jgi:hypothetical protein
VTIAATLAASVALGGLHGVVTRGPVAPVCRAGTPCSAPAAHVTLVFSRQGVTRRATTDAAGRYRVALRPGLWLVGAPRFGFRMRPASVRVAAGANRRVDLSLDTGIR